MKTKLNQALTVIGCLSSYLSSTLALPIEKGRTSVSVSGNLAKILSTTVDLGTFDTPPLYTEPQQTLSKRDRTWTVEAGDTGNGIAARLSIQFIQLAYLNQDVDWSNLQIGQMLTIPFSEDTLSSGVDNNSSSTFHTVIQGDTGKEIAATYGISLDQLQAFNPGLDWYNLQIGQRLTITGQQMATSTQGQAIEELNANLPAMTTQLLSTLNTPTTSSTTSTNSYISKYDNPFFNSQIEKKLHLRADDPLISAIAGLAIKTSTSTTTSSSTSTISSNMITVNPGDTAISIANRNGVSLVSLAIANPSVDLSILKPGQTLRLPAVKATALVSDQVAINSNIVSSVFTSVSARVGAVSSSTSIAMAPVSTSKQVTITVKSGDTYASIAASYVVSVAALASANTGVDSKNLKIGQILYLPANAKARMSSAVKQYGTSTTRISPITSIIGIAQTGPSITSNSQTYIVKIGDTGYSISAAYGVSFSDLSKANPGVTWTNLQVGQVLNIPSNSNISTSTSTSTATAPSTSTSGGILNRKSGTDIYLTYSGPASNISYPSINSWMSYDDLWNANSKYIGASCSFAVGTVAPNTAPENVALKSSILSVSAATGVNPSFILALVMQESNGCVRVPTTSSWEGIHNPGLLQSYNGNGTCNSNGQSLQPCPQAMINLMLMNGIAGVQGVGIVPALKQAAMKFGLTWSGGSTTSTSTSISSSSSKTATTSDSIYATVLPMQQNINTDDLVQSRYEKRTTQMLTSNLDEGLFYYMAARIYNSGSLSSNLDLSAPTGSTRCYVSDVVNRLMGWVTAPYNCTLS